MPPCTRVEWWRGGLSLEGLGEVGGRARVELREGGRHVLSLGSPQQVILLLLLPPAGDPTPAPQSPYSPAGQADLGTYACSANNSEGATRAVVEVAGPGGHNHHLRTFDFQLTDSPKALQTPPPPPPWLPWSYLEETWSRRRGIRRVTRC